MLHRFLVVVAFVPFVAGAAAAPAEPPLGHRDFYPTPERPVGFRGDGNGYFPGATPVTEWREGTVATRTEGRREQLVLTDGKSHNVAWKAEMPSWANTQPIVVGDRVFTTAEPNLLVCVGARTGKVLWTAAVNPWELIGLDRDRADRVQAMYDIWLDAIPHLDKMRGEGTMTRRLPGKEFEPIADAYLNKTLPRVLEALKRLDPEGPYEAAARVTTDAVRKYTRGLVESEQKGQPYPFGKHDPIKGQMDRLLDTLARRIDSFDGQTEAQRRKLGRRIPLDVPWGHLVGFCMSAPVSDGRHVYASFGQGQAVCYDLNGKRVWGVHYRPCRHEVRMSSIASPLLAGDVFVDVHGAMEVLRGLDKHTGKLLWEAPVKAEDAPKGGGYYVGSHKVMRLPSAKGPVEVVVTTLCNIVRASDGRVMGSLPFPFAPSGGPSIVGSGGLVFKGAVGDSYSTPYFAYRLEVSGDRVQAREVWRTRRRSTPGYQSVVLSPDALIMTSREHPVLDPRTGKVLYRDSAHPIAGFSNTLAGKVFLWADDGSKGWGGRGGEVFGSFGAADATDPARIKVITDRNVLGGGNKPRVPAMEKYAPELYALTLYTGNAYGWPAHFLHTDSAIFPSGNRLFIRSLSHLYCIGDPSAAYDWNPASRPADITKSLSSAEVQTAVPQPK